MTYPWNMVVFRDYVGCSQHDGPLLIVGYTTAPNFTKMGPYFGELPICYSDTATKS